VADDITITTDDLLRAEQLLRGAMREYAPDGNFRPGTFLNDVVIRALAYIPALVAKDANNLRKRQSLLRISDLAATEATSALEDLVSNWFLSRKDGSSSTGTVTVHFSPDVAEDVTVPADAEFVYDTGVIFNTDSSTALVFGRDTDMVKVLAASGAVSEYLLYVPVIAQTEGTVGNITAGRFSSYDAFSPYITFVEAESSFDNANSDESNAALIERSKTAITTRNLLTARSIDTVLKDEYADVLEVQVIGAGDTEMQRDIINLTTVASAPTTVIRVLGHVNVYLLLPIRKATLYPTGGTPETLLAGTDTMTLTTSAVSGFPFARIKRVTVDAVNYTRVDSSPIDDTATYSISVADSLVFGSMDQVLTLNIPTLAAPANRDVVVEFDGFRSLYNVDLVFRDRDRRVAAANTLAFALYPVVATIAINYYLSEDAPGDLPESDVKAALATYINTTAFSGSLRVTDIVTYFLGQYSTYLRGVGYPISIDYELQAPDGTTVSYSTQDKITVEDDTLIVMPEVQFTDAVWVAANSFLDQGIVVGTTTLVIKYAAAEYVYLITAVTASTLTVTKTSIQTHAAVTRTSPASWDLDAGPFVEEGSSGAFSAPAGAYADRASHQVSDRTVKVVTFEDLITLTAIP
jgi:hypothetical protein